MKLRDFTQAAALHSVFLVWVSLQTGCASHDASPASSQSALELRSAASTPDVELACTPSEVHPRACCSTASGCYLIGLDGDHPPCFESFEEVLASDVCCSANDDAPPTCRGATVPWSPPRREPCKESAHPFNGMCDPSGG